MEENNTNDVTKGDSTQEAPSTKPKKKKIKVILLIGIGVLVFAGAINYFFKAKISPATNLIYYVPSDAFLIIETDKPFTAWSKIKKTKAWNTIQQNEYLDELTKSVSDLDGSIDNLDIILSNISDRQVYISGHMYNQKSYDFLYLVDVQGLGVVEQIMTKLPGIKKRGYKEHNIYEYKPKGEKETFYFAFSENAFVCSYTHTLVEASLDESSNPVLGRSFEFIDINKEVADQGLFRIYSQHSEIANYLSTNDPEADYDTFVEHLNFSGLNFNIEEDFLKLLGYLNFSDSTPTLLNTLYLSGEAKPTLPGIAPKRTAFYLNFGFDDAEQFYDNIIKLASSNPEYGKDFVTSSRKLEKFLNINIKEDFISWIDKNIAILHTISQSGSSKHEFSLVIDATSGSDAKEKLDLLLRQVKRKTPVKFKSVKYKDYEINFISIKGFFKLIFGKLFSKLEKPYYTIIDDNVIFSNSPQTLRGIIDDVEREATLEKNSAFKTFQSEVATRSSLQVYLQTPIFLSHLDKLLDDEMLQLINPYKNQLKQFPQVSFSLEPGENMMATNMVAQYGRPNMLDTGEGEHGPQVSTTADTLFKTFSFQEELITEEDIHLEDLTAKKQAEEFESGKPKYEVSIKDGKKHGNYLEYYPNENIKIKGRYKEGAKHGIWKYYDEHGNQVKKVKFRDGVERL